MFCFTIKYQSFRIKCYHKFIFTHIKKIEIRKKIKVHKRKKKIFKKTKQIVKHQKNKLYNTTYAHESENKTIQVEKIYSTKNLPQCLTTKELRNVF